MKLGTVGQPLAGRRGPDRADGEILSRGPHIMKGYLQARGDPRGDRPDGWFHTGDIGHVDRTGSW